MRNDMVIVNLTCLLAGLTAVTEWMIAIRIGASEFLRTNPTDEW